MVDDKHRWPKGPAGQAALALGTVGVLGGLFVAFWPLGPDYYYTFRPVAQGCLKGVTHLYDAQSVGFYDAPWTVALFLPSALLPLRYGQALVLVGSLVGILAALWAWGAGQVRPARAALALGTLHTLDLLLRGNVDGFLALGLGLGWLGVRHRRAWLVGMGLWLLSVKPLNVLLAGLFFLRALWAWTPRERWTALAPVGLSLGGSFFCAGWDWPLRYLHALRAQPPYVALQTSLWRGLVFWGMDPEMSQQINWGVFLAALLVLGLWIRKVGSEDPLELALVTAANLAFSPYTLGSHYVLLAPVFLVVTEALPPLRWAWGLTWTPLLRLVGGTSWAWVDGLYPWALFLGALYAVRQQKGAPQG